MAQDPNPKVEPRAAVVEAVKGYVLPSFFGKVIVTVANGQPTTVVRVRE